MLLNSAKSLPNQRPDYRQLFLYLISEFSERASDSHRWDRAPRSPRRDPLRAADGIQCVQRATHGPAALQVRPHNHMLSKLPGKGNGAQWQGRFIRPDGLLLQVTRLPQEIQTHAGALALPLHCFLV